MMKRIVSFVLILAVFVLYATGCGKTAEPTAMNIYTISGPTGMGMLYLMEDSANGNTKHTYNFSVASDPQEVVGKITGGEADIAAVPTNMASSLYKRLSGSVSVLALNTSGNLFIIENGNTLNSIADLRGKTVYSTGQGANPEFVINYVLSKNGLTVGSDVKVEYLAQNEELIAKLSLDPTAILLAPQPAASSVLAKNQGARLAIDMTAEFEKVANTKMYMGCVIVRNEFLEKNEAAVKEFLAEYEKSVNSVLQNSETAAELCAKYSIVPAKAVALMALPYSGICYVDGQEMKTALSAYLTICKDEMPKLIGGELPGENFYYTAD